jgi:hypothetical protein
MAKNQISHGLLGRNTDGQTSYIDAQKRHNACIQYIGTGLDSDSGLDGVALRGCLSDADQYRVKLTTWCHEHKLKGRVFGKRAPGEAHIPGEVTARAPAAGAEIAADFLIGALHELLDYDVKLKELDQKVRAAQIERIKKELKACECKQWSQL